MVFTFVLQLRLIFVKYKQSERSTDKASRVALILAWLISLACSNAVT